MLIHSRNYGVLLGCLLLVACAAFAPAQTFEEKLAYAYGTHTALLQATANALEAGTLPVDDAKQILQLADESRTVLDTARLTFNVGDITTAEGQLALATNILVELRNYLNARAKP